MAKPKSRKATLSLSRQLNDQLRVVLKDLRVTCQEVANVSREELKKTKDIIKRMNEKIEKVTGRLEIAAEGYQERPTATAKARLANAKKQLKKAEKSLQDSLKLQEDLYKRIEEARELREKCLAREVALKAFEQDWRSGKKEASASTPPKESKKRTDKKETVSLNDSSETSYCQENELEIPPAVVALDKKIPEDIRVSLTGNESLSLNDLGGQNLVLYFYPKENTAGCSQEGSDFTAHYESFKERNTLILGVSRDSLASHEKFKEKLNFPFDLVADEDEQLCLQFGVIKMKNNFGKRFRSVERSTFLIDSDGVLRKAWRNVKVPGHVNEVLEAVYELTGDDNGESVPSSGGGGDLQQGSIDTERKSSLGNLLV